MDLSVVAVRQFLKTGGTEKALRETMFGLRLNISSGHGDFGIASEVKRVLSAGEEARVLRNGVRAFFQLRAGKERSQRVRGEGSQLDDLGPDADEDRQLR